MANRKPIGKTLRFKILSKYQFTCVYCGNVPPNVLLEIDHIVPVCKGGTNSEDNLVCSCFECNRGKSGNSIESSPIQNIDSITKEKLLQYKEYIKYIQDKSKLDSDAVQMVCDVYESCHEGYTPNDKYRINIRNFIDKINLHNTIYAMEQACIRCNGEMNYFCGICWNIAKQNPFK